MKTILFLSKRRLSAFAGLGRSRRMSFLFLVLLCGCGYRPLSASMPDGVASVVVPTAGNRTAYAGLAAPLTAEVRRKAAEAGVSIRASDARAARLEMTVVSVNGQPGMLRVDENQLVPVDQVWRIDVEAVLLDADGEILVPKTRLTASGRAFVVSNTASEEALGRERRAALMDDIAEAVVQYVFVR